MIPTEVSDLRLRDCGGDDSDDEEKAAADGFSSLSGAVGVVRVLKDEGSLFSLPRGGLLRKRARGVVLLLADGLLSDERAASGTRGDENNDPIDA